MSRSIQPSPVIPLHRPARRRGPRPSGRRTRARRERAIARSLEHALARPPGSRADPAKASSAAHPRSEARASASFLVDAQTGMREVAVTLLATLALGLAWAAYMAGDASRTQGRMDDVGAGHETRYAAPVSGVP